MSNSTEIIKTWDDEMVNEIFTMFIDDMPPTARNIAESKFLTIEQKRNFLIEAQKNFDKKLQK